MLMDEFEERMFPGHALGRSILGAEKLVNDFKRSDLTSFIERNYTTDQIVFACVGNISLKRVETFCRKVLEKIPSSTSRMDPRKTPGAELFELTKPTSVHQVHALIGAHTFGLEDDRRRAMVLMNNLLGGPALNSRLNLNIREKHGYCYYIESNYTPYSDCGTIQIYFGTDKRHQRRVSRLILAELNRLKDQKLTERTLQGAKKQLLGQIALAQENRVNYMLSLGKSLLNFDRIDNIDQVVGEVESITADEIQDLAKETFDKSKLSFLSYVPN